MARKSDPSSDEEEALHLKSEIDRIEKETLHWESEFARNREKALRLESEIDRLEKEALHLTSETARLENETLHLESEIDRKEETILGWARQMEKLGIEFEPVEHDLCPADEARDAEILRRAHQAEALGISVVHLLGEALLGESQVRLLEAQRWGGTFETFRSVINQGRRCDLNDERTRTTLERIPALLRASPEALGCPRVRGALEWLRGHTFLIASENLLEWSPWLPRLMRRIGKAISDPNKFPSAKRERRDKRRAEVLTAFEGARDLPSSDREDIATNNGFEKGGWDSLRRTAFAIYRAMESERRADAYRAIHVERVLRATNPERGANERAYYASRLGFESWEELCRFAEAAPARTPAPTRRKTSS